MKKPRIKLLITLFVVALVAIGVFFLRPQEKPSEPTPVPGTGAGYRSLTPGISSKEDALEALGAPLNDKESDSLLFRSNNPNLPNEILSSDDKVVFIKEIVTLADNKTSDSITQVYGVATEMLYGPESVNGFNLYVYPDKGIAYLGHVKESILLEVWYFQPTTLEEFIKTWAPEYSTTHKPIQ